MIKRPISKHYPALLPLIKKTKISLKLAQYYNKKYNLSKSASYKIYKVYTSKSLLKRKLGTSDIKLQEAKIVNLKIAIPLINNIVIRPKQIFSFWKLIGEPTYKKGYIDGMLLEEGKVTTGVGGGLCQLANIIHWLLLHTGMEIKEHWHHEYDIFPDSGRTIPFGSGAGVLNNYFDLQFVNNTNETYTIDVSLTDKHLVGEVWSDSVQNVKYSIKEEDHMFYRNEDQVFRKNKLYKLAINTHTGNLMSKTLVKDNNSKVLYPVLI